MIYGIIDIKTRKIAATCSNYGGAYDLVNATQKTEMKEFNDGSEVEQYIKTAGVL